MSGMKKYAEILIECGYADSYYMYHDKYIWEKEDKSKLHPYLKKEGAELCGVNPFADTLEGRRQADAIEQYLNSTVSLRGLWHKSIMAFGHHDDKHQWRLARIKWCVEQLEDKDETI